MAENLGLFAKLELDKKAFREDKREMLREWRGMFNEMGRDESRFNARRRQLGNQRLQAQRRFAREEIRIARSTARSIERIEANSQRRRESQQRGGVRGGRGRAGARGAVASARNIFGLGQFAVATLGVGAATSVGARVAQSWAEAGQSLRNYQNQLNLLLAKRGELEKAPGIGDSARQFARETRFTARDVRDAQIRLLAGRAQTGKLGGFIKALGELAAFNDTNLSDVSRPIGRLLAGDFGEGFERLRDFKISRQDLEGQGLKFSSGNQFKGTPEQAVEATIRAITAKFGGALEADTAEPIGKINRLTSAFVDLSDVFSPEVFPAFNRAVDNMTANLGDPLVQNTVREFGQGIGDIFDQISKISPQEVADMFKVISDITVGTANAVLAIANNPGVKTFMSVAGFVVGKGGSLLGASTETANKQLSRIGDLSFSGTGKFIAGLTGPGQIFDLLSSGSNAGTQAADLQRLRSEGRTQILRDINAGNQGQSLSNLQSSFEGSSLTQEQIISFHTTQIQQNQKMIKLMEQSANATTRSANAAQQKATTKTTRVVEKIK